MLRAVCAGWTMLSLAACGGAAQLAPPSARSAAPADTVEASIPAPSAAPAPSGPTTRPDGGEAPPRASAIPIAELATVTGRWRCRWADDDTPETWEIRSNGTFVRRYPLADGATSCVVDGKLELLQSGKVSSVERRWTPAECAPPPEHQAVTTTHTLLADGADHYWFGGTLEVSGDNELSCVRIK